MSLWEDEDPAWPSGEGPGGAAYAERPFEPEDSELGELQAAVSVIVMPSRHRRGELADAWRAVVRALGREEPAVRFVALQGVVQAGGAVQRSLPGARERLELAHALHDVAFADEEPRNRALAAVALGRLLRGGEGEGGALAGAGAMAALERGAFGAVRALLQDCFPDLKAPGPPPQAAEKAARDAWQRVWALAALGYAMEWGPGLEPGVREAVDGLLNSVLEAPLSYSRFLVCQVLRVLHAQLRPTVANRRRVALFFPAVSGLTARVPAAAAPATPDGLLAEELSGFWSRWYPRPDDATILRLPPQILSGYAARRQALLKGLRPPTALPAGPGAGPGPGRRAAGKGGEEAGAGAGAPRALAEGAPSLWPAEAADPAAYPEDPEDPTLTTLSDGASHPFRIQVEPGAFFSCVPAYGTVEGGRGVRCVVRFEPNAEGADPSQEVRGYLRVRTLRGFTVQRVALRACNGPLLRVISSRVDFGFCPVGDSRTDALFVRNVASVAVNCRVVRPAEAFIAAAASGLGEPPFNVAPLVSVLRPGELKQLRVSFEPRAPGRHEEVLTLYGAAGEAFEVALVGVGGQPLEVRDERLDFGPTSTAHEAVKELEVKNLDEANPLTVSCACPSPHVRVAPHTTVPPGATLRIPVVFQPARNGEWSSTLTVSAPNSAPTEVPLESWVGPMLFLPTPREIFFPPCSLGEPATVSIPLLSPSKYPVEFKLARLPKMSPFRYILWRNGEEKGAGAAAAAAAPPAIKPVPAPGEGGAEEDWTRATQGDMEKVRALAAPRQGSGVVMSLEITFESIQPGEFFRVPLQVELSRPYATKYPPYFLFGLCVPPTPPDDFWPKGGGLPKGYKELSVPALRAAISDKSAAPTKIELRKKPAPSMGTTAHRVTSRRGESISVRPAALTLFRSAPDAPATGSITLQNATPESQGYKILLSRPFFAERRLLDGTLGPRGSITVDVSFAPGADPASLHVGFAAVVVAGADVLQGVVPIQGADALPLSVLPDEKPIAFRLLEPGRRAPPQHLLLQSRSGAPLRWSLRMYAAAAAEGEGEGQGEAGAPALGEAAPSSTSSAADAIANRGAPQWDFEAGEENGTLAPWAARRVPLTFHGAVEGAFHRRLRLYVLPQEGGGAGPAACAYEAALVAHVGSERVHVAPTYLDFGRVALGGRKAGEVRAASEADVPCLLEVAARPPFRLAAERPLATLPPRGRLDIGLHCEPREEGEFAEPLLVMHGRGRSAVRALCWAGTRQLASRACAHLGADPHAALDFGLATRGAAVERLFPITNAGSLEVEVARIESSDGACLRWRALTAREAAAREASLEARDEGGAVDGDWDEADFQAGINPDEQPSDHFRVAEDLLEPPFALPASLAPGRTLHLLLSFQADTGGEFRPRLSVWTRDEPGAEPRESFVWQCVGSVQPPLRFAAPSVDFGIIPLPAAKSMPVEIMNPGFMAMDWALRIEEIKCVRMDAAGAAVEVPPSSFAVHPLSGRLEPKASAKVELRCAPLLAQHRYTARLVLLTGDGFGEAFCEVSGVGASAALRLSAPAVDFGCIRIGVKKIARLDVENDGLVEGRFEIESDLPASDWDLRLVSLFRPFSSFLSRSWQREDLFVLVPDRGAVAPKGKLTVGVHFRPPSGERYRSAYAVRWRATGAPRGHAGKPLHFVVGGSGGMPHLHVPVPSADLGCILIEDVAVAEIDVHNLGAAEASAVAEVVNPSRAGANITVDPADAFFVPANASCKLRVLVFPKTLAPVSASVVVKPLGEDTATTKPAGPPARLPSLPWARTYTIAVRATVGAPKLHFAPSASLPNVDFGVCRLRRPQVDVFVVENRGDVDLPYEMLFVRRLPRSAAGTLRPQGRRWFRLATELRERGAKRLTATEIESAPPLAEGAAASEEPGEEGPGRDVAGLYEAYDPGVLAITPAKGTLRSLAAATEFFLTFVPREYGAVTKATLLFRNAFETRASTVAGSGGDVLFEVGTPLRLLDFGRCRLGANFTRELTVRNRGNLTLNYYLRPEPVGGDWSQYFKEFREEEQEELEALRDGGEEDLLALALAKRRRALGLAGSLAAPSTPGAGAGSTPSNFASKKYQALAVDAWEGSLAPGASASVLLSFSPRAAPPVSVALRAYHTGGYEALTLAGSGGEPKLELLGPDNRPLPLAPRAPDEEEEEEVPAGAGSGGDSKKTKKKEGRALAFDFGTVSVREARLASLRLVNSGSFPADFYIPDKLPGSLEVTPRAGLLAPRQTAQLLLRFAPRDDRLLLAPLSLLWEGTPLRLAVSGRGGSGDVRPAFLAPRDALAGELDFGVVPLRTPLHKLFRVTNAGTVPLSLTASCSSPGFSLGRFLLPSESAALGYRGEALRASSTPQETPQRERRGSVSAAGAAAGALLASMQFGERAEARVEPGGAVDLPVRILVDSTLPVAGAVQLESDFNSGAVALRGAGGVMRILHGGDLDFGEVAAGHSYTRSVTLYNEGTISAIASVYLLLPDYPRLRSALVLLAQEPPAARDGPTLWRLARQATRRLMHARRRKRRTREGEQLHEAFFAGRPETPTTLPAAELAAQQRLVQREIAAGRRKLEEQGRATTVKIQGLAAGVAPTAPPPPPRTVTLAEELVVEGGPPAGGSPAGGATPLALSRSASMKGPTKSALKVRPAPAGAPEAAARRLEAAGAAADERMASLAGRQHAALEARDAAATALDPRLAAGAAQAAQAADAALPFGARALTVEEALGRSLRVPTAGPVDGAPFVMVSPARALLPRVRGPGEDPAARSPRAGEEATPRGTRSRVGPEEPQHLTLTVTLRTARVGAAPGGFGWGVGRPVKGTLVVEAEARHPALAFPHPTPPYTSRVTVDPREGELKTGDAVRVHFVFHPLREGLTAKPIFFDPLTAAPLRFKVLAGGGAYRLACGTALRHELGRCMMNAWTVGSVRLRNEGTAYLPIRSIHLEESPVFKVWERERESSPPGAHREGEDFPRGARQIPPGGHFDVPVLFNPPSEDQFVGRLIVRTKVDRFKVEVTGTGRHAVLTLSKSKSDFLACVIGNVYYDSLELSNVGDLQYPVDITLKEPFPDLDVTPSRLVVEAFRAARVTLTLRPTASMDRLATVLLVKTPYAEMEVPVHVQSGRVELEVTPRLDFGHFQAGSSPRRTLAVRNAGDMACHWQLRRPPALNPLLRWSRTEGRLEAGAAVDLVATFVSPELLNDATVVRAAEFALVSFGACPVGDPQTRSFVVQNYGGFPFTYTLRHVYPIKVNPLKGTIPGHGQETFTVRWVPNGGFEMHSSIKIVSNVGVLDVLVTGKGAYPEFAVDPPLVNFGVTAIGFHATRTISVRNTGLVSVEWSVPAVEAPFSVQPDRGRLEPRASAPLEVTFAPGEGHRGRQGATFLVAARARYKEVSVAGVGGALDVRFEPPTAGLGVLPVGQAVRRTVVLENRSEVGLSLALSFEPSRRRRRRRRRTPDGEGVPAEEADNDDADEEESSADEEEEEQDAPGPPPEGPEWPLGDVELAVAPAALLLGPGERGAFTLACTLRRQRAFRCALVARARSAPGASASPARAPPSPSGPSPAPSSPPSASRSSPPGPPRSGPRLRPRRRGPLALPVHLASSPPPPPLLRRRQPRPPRTPSRPPAAAPRPRPRPRRGGESLYPPLFPTPDRPRVQVVADVLESLLVALAGVAGPAAPAARRPAVPRPGPPPGGRGAGAGAGGPPARPPAPAIRHRRRPLLRPSVASVSVAGLLAAVGPACGDPAAPLLRAPPPFPRREDGAPGAGAPLVPAPPPGAPAASAFRPLRPTLPSKRGKR
eukprot:tig00000076_g2413.t1